MSFHRQFLGKAEPRAVIGLIAVSLIGLLLRVVEIDRWPLWSDEALTLMIAQRPVEILFLAPVDPTPGLYYSLHKLLLGPMVDAAAARSISVLCGTLLIPAVYFMAREARVPALLGAALVALSFPLIDYSQEARAYSLLVLLVTLSAAFFMRWSRSRGSGALLGALATCLLAFYTHFASVFWIGPVVLAIFWIGRRDVLKPLLLTALLAVPELLRVSRFPSDGFVWLAQATPLEAADTLARMLLPFRPGPAWLAASILLVGWRSWVHRSRIAGWASMNPGAATAIAILSCAPLLVWLFGFAGRPIFMTRTILIGVPGIFLAVALLLKFEQRGARFALVALYALSLLTTGTTRQKEDWYAVAERVGRAAILMCQPGEVAAMRHASAGANRIFLNRPDARAEMSGEPWQRAYYDIMADRRRMNEALKLGASASPSLHPVWPVRSAQVLTPRPVSLDRAAKLCEQHGPDGPGYIAD